MARCLVVAISFLLSINLSFSQNPIVCNDGVNCVEGTTVPASNGDNAFQAFYGIPYAEPPVGNLRFANPIPKANWFGNHDATEPKEACIQKFIVFPNANVTGVEDCLYLNVYRPIGDFSFTRLHVIVWIHGGGFFGGSPNLDGPQPFLNTNEVIWVSMAYRLGALGFLSTGDEHSPGNYGFKDQSLALRWVRENIDAFGGNASSITLMGVSAGAAAVHMHMLSPLSQGLFDRAIVMSGSALAPYNFPISDPLAQAMQQGELLGIEAVDSQDLISQLRNLDAYAIVDSIEGMKVWDLDPLTTYKTVIEANTTGAFMIEHPQDISINGNYHHIPWITGVVEEEGAVRAATIVVNQTLLDDLNTQLEPLLPMLMEINIHNDNNIAEIVRRIIDRYFNGSTTITEENDHRLIDLYSDRAFNYPYYKMIEHYVQYSDAMEAPVGLYRFAFRGEWSYSYFITGSTRDFGVIHLDDTLYMFRTELPIPSRPVDLNVTSNLINFFVTFAKTGRPHVLNDHEIIRQCTLDVIEEGHFCDYQEFINSTDGNTLEIHIRNDFDVEMVEFWDEIFELADRSGSLRIQMSISVFILMIGIFIKSVLY